MKQKQLKQSIMGLWTWKEKALFLFCIVAVFASGYLIAQKVYDKPVEIREMPVPQIITVNHTVTEVRYEQCNVDEAPVAPVSVQAKTSSYGCCNCAECGGVKKLQIGGYCYKNVTELQGHVSETEFVTMRLKWYREGDMWNYEHCKWCGTGKNDVWCAMKPIEG